MPCTKVDQLHRWVVRIVSGVRAKPQQLCKALQGYTRMLDSLYMSIPCRVSRRTLDVLYRSKGGLVVQRLYAARWQNVVRLQISVENILGMHVLDSRQHLLKDSLRFLLGHLPRLLQVVAKLATPGQFHDDHFACILRRS